MTGEVRKSLESGEAGVGGKGMEGKGCLGGYRKREVWGQFRGPTTLGPFTRQRRRPAPPSPVAMRRRQHPAGKDHAPGLGGRRPLCRLCTLETDCLTL